MSLLALLSSSAVEAQVVMVDGGSVRGKAWNASVLFRGIPFAAPPLGELRWKPPQPVIAWRGVRDSLDQPPSCIQNDQGWNHSDFLIGREDCLTLDVRTPSLSGRRPVLVWIHGGSNRAGGPNDIVLSDVGAQVVIVGVRYRLGIFGFLSHRKLTAEQGASGNYALIDQLTALRWVRRNIRKFGGDPDNVTIAGESAGSEDVSLMLAAPAAQRLFHNAIMESGTPGFGMPFRSLAEAERIGDQADALLRAGGDVRKMRRIPAAALLAADLKLHEAAGQPDAMLWLRTTIDGSFLPRSPRELLKRALPHRVILGSNRVEFGIDRPHRDGFMAMAFGKNLAAARRLYRLDQPDPPADSRLGTRDEQIGTDIIFRCPAHRFAEIMAAKGAPVWHYEFDAAPGGAKTSHAAEIPYAFGDAKLAGGLALKPYWINFIRSGDPNGDGLPRWPRFTVGTAVRMLFSESGVAPEAPSHAQSCSLLDRL